MDKMPLSAILFQSIPESLILLYLGLASIGIRPVFPKVLLAAVLSSLLSWLVRWLPLPYGIHTVIGIVVITLLILMFFRVELIKAVVGTIFAVTIFVSTEALVLPIMTIIIGVTNYQEIWGRPVLRLVLAVPELLLLGALAYFLVKKGISFESFTNRKNKGSSEEYYDQ